MIFRILILDDEQAVCNSLRRILNKPDREILIATTADMALQRLNEKPIDLLLLDYRLGDTDGLHFLQQVKDDFPDLLVIMITAHGNIDVAVEAMKYGAYDFIQKREEPEVILFNVQRALDNLRLKKEVEELRNSFLINENQPAIVAYSPGMKAVVHMADEFAKSDSTILITGETGTGKSILAEYIHHQSSRFNKPFVSINCSAIPSELIESELFGYEHGAFTGARQKGKKGLVEMADNGTLFLDEIGELNMDMQAKLLHVLEKGAFHRVGAVEPTSVNVRFIAATNTDLQEKVQAKEFRMDLFYRLNVAQLSVPPLRERREDILPLAKLFIDQFNKRFNKQVKKISKEAEQFLTMLPWPGNVRELRNFIERMMILKKNESIEAEDLSISNPVMQAGKEDSIFQVSLQPADGLNLLHEAQKEIITQALKMVNHNISRAAELVGIPRTSLTSCMKRFNIQKETTD
ncbi:MAG TPA: sigma-54-dependent Fis family transcriptional regulator [Caldithrix abyssi]|uniref:Sigma-54-dependent Fis family transcriptional regulator n=1 Tax=Caldithrix abyssi TaxID=187145 RepID=A0A7V4U1U9_CALAY|nr:sigma-54-dependent Fis family transcriptional regulator [Caldithrix abyssi]